MTNLVVLAEEPSGRIVAEMLCQRMGLADRVQCLEHEGRTDLEGNITRRIAGWRGPTLPRFIIMRDNDGSDCRANKTRLFNLVPRPAADRVKIRIVMQALESWYFGDMRAIAKAGLMDEATLARQKNDRRFRQPDAILNPKQEFKRKIANRGQLELARAIGPHLSLTDNRSPSFRSFVAALEWASQRRQEP